MEQSEAAMEFACFGAGMLFSTGQYFLAKKLFALFVKPEIRAIYIVQRLTLDFMLLAVVTLISDDALGYSAAGLISVACLLPISALLKR